MCVCSAVLDHFEPIELRTNPLRPLIQPAEFNLGTFSTSLFVGMLFVLVPVSLAVDTVYDREQRTRNQLRINGLSAGLYFGAFFILLGGLMLLVAASLLAMVHAFDVPAFRQPAALLTLGLLVALYCPAAILCATSCAYLFDRSDSAQSILPNVLTFVGVIPFVLVAAVDMLAGEPEAARRLHAGCAMLCPVYVPYAAVYYVERVFVTCRDGGGGACGRLELADYWTPEVWWMAAGAVLHVPLWLAVLRVLDVWKSGGSRVADAWRTGAQRRRAAAARRRRWERKVGRVGHGSDDEAEFEDDDVRAEREKVERMGGAEGVRAAAPAMGRLEAVVSESGETGKNCGVVFVVVLCCVKIKYNFIISDSSVNNYFAFLLIASTLFKFKKMVMMYDQNV